MKAFCQEAATFCANCSSRQFKLEQALNPPSWQSEGVAYWKVGGGYNTEWILDKKKKEFKMNDVRGQWRLFLQGVRETGVHITFTPQTLPRAQ